MFNERAAHLGEQARAGFSSPRYPRKLLRGIGVVSIIAGVVAACFAASPEILSTLSTAHLMGIFVLVLGPALTMYAMRFERKTRATVEVATASVEQPLRIAKHGAHERSSKSPPRIEERPEKVRSHEHAA